MYSGTVADFSATDSLIYRGELRTEQYDYKHLNGECSKTYRDIHKLHYFLVYFPVFYPLYSVSLGSSEWNISA